MDAPGKDWTEPAVPEVPVAKTGLPKVAILGDGIAAGRQLAPEQTFPALLARELRARDADVMLFSADGRERPHDNHDNHDNHDEPTTRVQGTPAYRDSAQRALQRVEELLQQHPDVVVIELGASDALQGLPVAAIEADVRAVIAKVRAAHAEPMLLGLRIPASYGDAYARDFALMYPRVARELKVPFLPTFTQGVTGHKELTLSDGVHPTPEGHERLASNVAEPLKALLAQLRGKAKR